MSKTTAATGGGEVWDDPFLQIWLQGKWQRKLESLGLLLSASLSPGSDAGWLNLSACHIWDCECERWHASKPQMDHPCHD